MTSQFLSQYKLRWKRRRLLWRSYQSRKNLHVIQDNTNAITRKDQVLCFAVIREEITRLPHWLAYNRKLGVDHFLIVDNNSQDGSRELLSKQPDVSLWSTKSSYHASRFGLDWATWLMMKYGHGHWCLYLDADEILVYPHHENIDLNGLTGELENRKQVALGTLMLDLYPKGPLGAQTYLAGDDPLTTVSWFDAGPYRAMRQLPKQNLWVQGGMRERAFFADEPRRSPTLNKIPLVKWDRRFAYTNSTHAALPSKLNFSYDGPADKSHITGALLHTKYLPEILDKSNEEKARKQHFHTPELFDHYYDSILKAPNLWNEASTLYKNWEQLEQLGLMHSAGWRPDMND